MWRLCTCGQAHPRKASCADDTSSGLVLGALFCAVAERRSVVSAASPERRPPPVPTTARSLALRRLRRLLTRENGRVLAELTRAALKESDHNSLLGATWSLLSPFVMLVALYLIFRNRFGEEVQAYPLYLLTGVSLVSYFVTTTHYLISVLLVHRPLLLNTTVPREAVIASQLAVHSYRLFVEMLACAVLSAYYGLLSPVKLLAIPPLLLAYVGMTAGVGMVLALIHCFARDIQHIWSLSSRLFLFVTPVFYTLDSLSPAARFAVTWLNPLTPFLTALRALFTAGSEPQPLAYGFAIAIALLVFGSGYAAFLHLEGTALERA